MKTIGTAAKESFTRPMAAAKDYKLVVSGGEAGVRGFLDAYDAATGERLWRFQTVPGPGEPGNETWAGDSWKTGGGPTWLTGSYDPELNLIYWGIGNPSPDFNPAQRKGDNLYTNSVVALDPKTGKLVWHYQFTPNDGHDWDATEDMVLTDRMVDGKMRKVLLHGDRNGFFYMLDRTNGQFLSGHAFVTQTWNDGFDAKGRPKVRPESVPTPQGVRVSPSIGATNFQAPSYDAKSGIFYLFFQDAEAFNVAAQAVYEPGKLFWGRGDAPRPAPSREARQGFMAWDVAKARPIWTLPFAPSPVLPAPWA
jgi:alcohol dehydrogenase (cytochrome c)